MTPMQMLKNNFLLLSQKLNKFEEINLNKSQEKDVWIQNVDDEYALCFQEESNFSHFIKKGVKSDFLKIYKAKTKKEVFSIGFHFTYLNTPEPTIKCSIKQDELMNFSEEMGISEFKEKLNYLNNALDSPEILDSIMKIKEVFSISQPKKKLKI